MSSLLPIALLTLGLFAYIFWPERNPFVQADKTRIDSLRERKDAIYENLRDLNFEYLAGKYPETEYADQSPNGPIELRIYKGANGEFDLYEDSGDGYEYERGQHSIIRIRWDDQSGVLTIGTREGTFPGLVDRRMFRIVLVGNGHGIGEETTDKVDREVRYDGKEIRIEFGQHLLL